MLFPDAIKVTTRERSVRIGMMGDVVLWLERRNSNPKTLGSIPWWGRVRGSFSVPPSQLLCRLVRAVTLLVCMARTQCVRT